MYSPSIPYRQLRKMAVFCFALALAIAVFAFMLGGCGARVKHVTNLPAGVTEQQVKNWDSAVGGLHKIALTTTTLRQTIIALNKATYTEPGKTEAEKVIPDGKIYIALLSGTARVDQAQIDAANFLKTVPNTWSASTQDKIRAYMNAIVEQIGNMTDQGIIGIKNPASQQQVKQLLGEIRDTAGLILSLATQ
ncbi:MAG: hypothetical protein ACREVZ_06610 [Burkholderiales bacterium]